MTGVSGVTLLAALPTRLAGVSTGPTTTLPAVSTLAGGWYVAPRDCVPRGIGRSI